jgi:hypothetical protein
MIQRSLNQNQVTADSQSVRLPWCQVPPMVYDLKLISFETYITTTLWVSSLMRQQVCHLLKRALTVPEA